MHRTVAAASFLMLAAILPLDAARTYAQEAAIHADEGRPHVRWEDAGQVVGQTAFVYGKVINTHELAKLSFINFDSNRPADFAGVVFEANRAKFPASLDEAYLGKVVRMRGVVSTFKGKPQMVLADPDQIEVIDAMPELEPLTPRTQGAQRAKDGELVIAAFNVLNMFDNVDDPYHNDEGTPAKPRKQLTALAQAIKTVDADVLAMEEVENRGYLQRFVEVFLPDMGYEEVVLYEGNDGRGIDVCLLSRVPVGPVTSYRHVTFEGPQGEPRRFNRDILAVTLLPEGGKPIEAWVVHLKSNSGGREAAEPIRLAEAKQLRKMLDEELAAEPDDEIVVLGDFNDVWGSPTLNTIVGSGETALWSAATELGPNLPDTYNQGEFHSMIDFLLCSPALAKRHVSGSTHILPGSPEETGSDHNPVWATFRVK